MKTIEKLINKGEYLAHIFENMQIPTNIILQKTLPGLGATYLEISCKRHSVVIEPNVPVIVSKVKKNNGQVLGVYSKTTYQQIVKYLTDPKIKFKKILCTPESFQSKVIHIMGELNIDVYNEYFLLYDECDRTSKDVDFRKDIVLPMQHFFKFKNKAFVSATAVIPSDPEFEEHDFTIVKITPTYAYHKKLDLVVSDNPKTVLKKLIAEIDNGDDSPIFIFFNSALGIASIIEQFKIENESSVFCGQKAKDSLKKSTLKPSFKIEDEVNETTISRYNFLTSRYYSALDVDLPEGIQAHVIVITDMNAAEHTIIDPYSDLIQIPGRFRNTEETPNRLKSFTFITNIKEDLPFKTEEEAKGYIDGVEDGYSNLITLRDTAPSQGFKDLIQEALDQVFFSNYVNDDGTKNYFMYDNYFYKEKLKSYYTDAQMLKSQFTHSLKDVFSLNFSERNYKTKSFYSSITNYKKYRERIMEVVELLEQMKTNDSPLFSIPPDWDIVKEDLQNNYTELVNLYSLVGKDIILQRCHSKNDIERLLLEYKQSIDGIKNDEIFKELKIILKLNLWYDQRDLLEQMKILYSKYGLPYSRTVSSLEKFYRVDKKKVKGYPKIRLVEQKFK